MHQFFVAAARSPAPSAARFSEPEAQSRSYEPFGHDAPLAGASR